MSDVTTRTVEVPGAILTFDIRPPTTPSMHRPLFIFGSPIAASGFEHLVAHFSDRAVITYDPPPFEPDLAALRASPVRIVPAIGTEGEGTLARRGGEALARELDVTPVVFPGDHGGFTSTPMSPSNDPEAFAATLREVLDQE